MSKSFYFHQPETAQREIEALSALHMQATHYQITTTLAQVRHNTISPSANKFQRSSRPGNVRESASHSAEKEARAIMFHTHSAATRARTLPANLSADTACQIRIAQVQGHTQSLTRTQRDHIMGQKSWPVRSRRAVRACVHTSHAGQHHDDS